MIDEFADLIPYYSVLYILIAFLIVISIRKYRNGDTFFSSEREKIISITFGVFFTLFYVSGLVLSSGASFTTKSVSLILASCALFSAAVGIGYRFITLFLDKHFNAANGSGYLLFRHSLLSPFFIIIACWLPVFLALYPGLFAYDVAGQMYQTRGSYSTHHPLLHTLFLQAFYKLGEKIGSYNDGMAISVIIQMVLVALSLAYSIQYMINKRVKRSVVIAALMFFSVIPIFPILAVSMTKDILFSAAFVASFVKILQLIDNGLNITKIWDWISIIALFILTSLLRSNGKYAVFAVLVALVLKAITDRANLKKMYPLLVLTIVFTAISNHALVRATHALPVSKNEMMSVPYQQLARVYRYNINCFTSEDRAAVERIIPSIGSYNEHISDGVKGPAKVFDSHENEKEFWHIYFKYMLKQPVRYAEAFLITSIGYWYLDDISNSQMYGRRADGGIDDDFGLFLMDTKPGYGITHESKLPWLDKIIKKLFHENKYQKLPVIAVVFSMGTYFWLIVLSFFYCVQKKNKEAAVPLVFILSYIATVLAGPCSLIRYALPYIACLPALMVTAYKADDVQAK